MNFGEAIDALKTGKKIARSGWNGNNMFVYLNKGCESSLPDISMRTADGSKGTGWLAYQTDILAEDWLIVD